MTWKAGFQQRIIIHRPQAKSRRERHWTGKEDGLLRILYPSSSTDIIMAALPDRSWRAITLRALRLKLKRKRHYHAPRDWRPWTQEEDERLKISYEAAIPLKEIACELRRSIASIVTRAANKRLRRPLSIRWVKSQISSETHDLIPLEPQSSGR